jgi:hypothetical protein
LAGTRNPLLCGTHTHGKKTAIIRAYRLHIITLLGLLLGITACDSDAPTTNVLPDNIQVESVTVDPDTLDFLSLPFTASSDTTITLNYDITLSGLTSGSYRLKTQLVSQLRDSVVASSSASISSSDQPLTSVDGTLELSASTRLTDHYTLTFGIEAEYGAGTWAELSIPQLAEPGTPPEILDYNVPSPVSIPAVGSKEIPFTAKVTDEEGQISLQSVRLDILTTNGQLVGDSPYAMKDDGSTDSGDETAQDSVYTVTFSINSDNQPAEYRVRIYAFDHTGLSSDTVTTDFVLE